MTKPRINWDLGFGFSLGFGAWSLGFRPWPWVLLFDAFEIDPESYVVADGADHEGHAVVAAFDGEGSAETGAVAGLGFGGADEVEGDGDGFGDAVEGEVAGDVIGFVAGFFDRGAFESYFGELLGVEEAVAF